MAFTSIASNKGNRFSTHYHEVSIVCLVQEYLVLKVTAKSDLLLPCLGSLKKQGTQPAEIVRVSVRRLVDSYWLSNFRELVWGYFAAGRPTPAPPRRVTFCQFVPGAVSCTLVPVSICPDTGLIKAYYEYKLVITYEDDKGVTGHAEINSGPLVSVSLAKIHAYARCEANLEVSVLEARIMQGDPKPVSGPLPVSPNAANTLRQRGLTPAALHTFLTPPKAGLPGQ